MPTFLIFRNGSIHATIKGADPRGLTTAVEAASKLASKPSPLSGPGHTLGGTPAGAKPRALRQPWNFSLKGIIDAIIGFLGLYLISLLSLNPYKAAQESAFNIHNTGARGSGSVGARTLGGKAVGGGGVVKPAASAPKKFSTLSDVVGKDD